MDQKSHDQTDPIYHAGEHSRHNNLTRHGVAAGDQPEKIAEKNKEKEGGDEREKSHSLFAHRIEDHAANEVHHELRYAL